MKNTFIYFSVLSSLVLADKTFFWTFLCKFSYLFVVLFLYYLWDCCARYLFRVDNMRSCVENSFGVVLF